jgi:hypothetical protein
MKAGYAVITVMIFLSSIAVCRAEEPPKDANFVFTKSANEEMVFLQLRRVLTSKANPDDLRKARFGIAEYYFAHHDLLDAFRAFKEYAETYPPQPSSFLAKVYLYKIANLKGDTEIADALKKEIFTSSFVLLFSKFKVLKYQSAFENRYEIHYYLDKIQVFLNGGKFEEITP